jgi:hypothetical protein
MMICAYVLPPAHRGSSPLRQTLRAIGEVRKVLLPLQMATTVACVMACLSTKTPVVGSVTYVVRSSFVTRVFIEGPRNARCHVQNARYKASWEWLSFFNSGSSWELTTRIVRPADWFSDIEPGGVSTPTTSHKQDDDERSDHARDRSNHATSRLRSS